MLPLHKIWGYCLLVLTIFWLMGCRTDVNTESERTEQTVLRIEETVDELDTPVNDYLAERLKSIRANFTEINKVKSWTRIDTVNTLETPEGGNTVFYYLDGVLKKIVTRHFAETFQQLSEYYLREGNLFFVIEKHYQYNRPIYYDSAMALQNSDTEVFEFSKSEIEINRSYFENGKLIHQLSNLDCGAPYSDKYLEEEGNRIISDFDQLMKVKRKNSPTGLKQDARPLRKIG